MEKKLLELFIKKSQQNLTSKNEKDVDTVQVAKKYDGWFRMV